MLDTGNLRAPTPSTWKVLESVMWTPIFLAAARSTDAGLWTRDDRLAAAATRLGLTDRNVPKT